MEAAEEAERQWEEEQARRAAAGADPDDGYDDGYFDGVDEFDDGGASSGRGVPRRVATMNEAAAAAGPAQKGKKVGNPPRVNPAYSVALSEDERGAGGSRGEGRREGRSSKKGRR